MPRPPAIWEQWELEARADILKVQDECGARLKDLAAWAGFPDTAAGRQAIVDWKAGRRRLTQEQIDLIRAGLASYERSLPTPGSPGSGAESGEFAEPSDAELASMPRDAAETDELRALVRPHAARMVFNILQMANYAKSETVRLRANEMLLDRGFGRAIQQIIDLTPKAPAENVEVLEALRKVIEDAERSIKAAAEAEASTDGSAEPDSKGGA